MAMTEHQSYPSPGWKSCTIILGFWRGSTQLWIASLLARNTVSYNANSPNFFNTAFGLGGINQICPLPKAF